MMRNGNSAVSSPPIAPKYSLTLIEYETIMPNTSLWSELDILKLIMMAIYDLYHCVYMVIDKQFIGIAYIIIVMPSYK